MALADGIDDQVLLAKAAYDAAVAAENRARGHKEALEELIENAGNTPEP